MYRLTRWIRSFSRFDWLWLGWLLSGAAIELAALRDARKGDTFSEAWWWMAGIGDTRNRYAWITRGLLFGFSSWLVSHLWTRRV